MLPEQYVRKLSNVVENLRKVRGIKQITLAIVLDISDGKYTKRATGQRPFTCSQLRQIGRVIGVSHLHILAIADACFDPSLSITPLSRALASLFNVLEAKEVNLKWSKDRIVNSLRGLISSYEE